MSGLFLGVDIGTGSSKGVLADACGDVVATATRPHRTASPEPGRFEHDAEAVWAADCDSLIAELAQAAGSQRIEAVCVSGLGPCVLVTDGDGTPLRPAILYGIDTRAGREIGELEDQLGGENILHRNGNRLTTQAVAPKLAWLARHEPQVWARARRWYTASTWLAGRLTGEYVCDHYTASVADPLYDLEQRSWWDEAWDAAAPAFERPRLVWPGEVVSTVTAAAQARTGLPAGTPVLAGTIDAVAEAQSVGVDQVGDTMLMYGSTMFLIQVTAHPVVSDGLWAATGRTAEHFSVAAGMATSGLVTTWLADVTGQDVGGLVGEAAGVPAGSRGLVLLPYFAGERTPLFDARARGVWLGLTLHHTRAHLARSVLEGIAYGVRHNLETMREAGAPPRRLVAVGGGTQEALWPRIVSEVTGLAQDIPATTVGAAYGDARAAAGACGVDASGWNPVVARTEPDPSAVARYDALYQIYRRTYAALRDDMHLLATLEDIH